MSGFFVDDTPIYDAYIAGRMSAALSAGVHIGLFEFLESRSLSAEDIAQEFGLSMRPVNALMKVFEAMSLVKKEGELFRLTPSASAYLVKGKPGWLGGLIGLEVENFLSPSMLIQSLRADKTAVYGGGDPWEAHAEDPGKARAFTAAMHSISERPAWGLAEAFDFSSVERLLDIGGGSGVLSIAVAKKWTNLSATIFDLSVVCDIAAGYISDAGLKGRIKTQSGDMFQDEWPVGYDAILLSQILHDWSEITGKSLLKKAYKALPAGGRILIHEKLVHSDRPGPLANALVNLDMMVWTEGQQYTEAQLVAALGDAGFTDIECRPTTGYWSAVIGKK